ncbi:hypothetical protein EB001_05045 [bacterium]|nr:hypothetical protein [bacterium]
MTFVVRLAEKNAFWTGDEEAVWSDDLDKAKKYESDEDAEDAIKYEIPDYYPLVAVDTEDALLPEEEPVAE